MGMSNRELTTINRHAIALEENTKEIKTDAGKRFRKERELLEKANGGAKKLAQADKYVAKMEMKGAGIVADAEQIAQRRLDEADKLIVLMRADIQERARLLDGLKTSLADMGVTLAQKSRAQEQTTLDLKARQDAAEARQMAQDTRDSELRTRETKADEREGEIARFDAWRAAAPA